MKTIVFDLDGTLIHSAPDIHAAANAMLTEQGAAPQDLATIISFVGNGLPKLTERVLAHAGLALERRAELTNSVLAHYNRENGKRTTVYDGAATCLDALRDAGHSMGICTNKPEAPARKILAKLGLDHFGAVFGGDSLPVRKPDPEPLFATIEALGGTPENTLYVGDSETDAETAKNAGIAFALYAHGYRKQPLEAFETALTFDHFDALTTYIRS